MTMVDKLIMLLIGLAVGFAIGFLVCAVLMLERVKK